MIRPNVSAELEYTYRNADAELKDDEHRQP